MPSLIPGYNYDIFISYRQKDNKYDGWVTEFVDNLKKELEATFKEDISVYFDVNPHDGLLETHDVDASLKDKLKCLVFIPIISHTYCDPKSFAWEHELKTFMEEASKDQFGLKVKLPNGNVASRVLPVRIHDLDNEDIKLCESVFGGYLRGVEFIYKSAGVNRPLRLIEDKPHDNLNKTIYRDQINKVANGIKEIISGLKSEAIESGTSKQESRLLCEKEKKGKVLRAAGLNKYKRFWIIITIIIILLLLGIYIYPKLIDGDSLKKLRSSDGKISVAVMPFQNLTADTLFNIWQLGLQNLLITSLSNSEGLSVRQYETMEKIIGGSGFINYTSVTPSFAASVALKLEANTVIIGNIYKTGTRIRVTANLMDSGSEEIYKSYEIDGNTEDDFFPITDSLSGLIKDFLEINKLKKKYPVYDLKNIYTSSAEALKYYIQGRIYHSQLDYNSAIELYVKSVNKDTNFIIPMLMLSYACGDIGKSRESKMWVYKAYNRISDMPYDIQLQINELKAAVDKKPDEQIKYLQQYIEFNPYAPVKLYTLGWVFYITEQWQDAIDAFEKGIELIKQLGSGKKLWIWNYLYLGNAYHNVGEHNKEIKIYEEGFDLWPDKELLIINDQTICSLYQGDTVKACELLTNFRAASKKENYSDPYIESTIGLIYQKANIPEKAMQHYRSAIKAKPADISTTRAMNYLAYLLIDNGINIGEGMTLIDSALKTNPPDEELLASIYETRGWGLYKQGKYTQAMEDLKKGWDLRPFYSHRHFLHLEEVKKIVAGQK